MGEAHTTVCADGERPQSQGVALMLNMSGVADLRIPPVPSVDQSGANSPSPLYLYCLQPDPCCLYSYGSTDLQSYWYKGLADGSADL